MTLGAGLVLMGCGDDATTTPAPAPPPPPPPPAPEPEPEPPPAPEPPATPTGLHVDETTETSIEWHWNKVEGATAYVVQVSMNEMFGDEDDHTDITLENHYAVTELEPDTTVYLRVAAAIGTSVEDAILSAFTTHVTGMSNQPPPPPPPPNAPATPTGLMAESGEGSITWSWDAVEGALAYVVQVSDDEMFDDTDIVVFDGLPITTETSYTAMDLEPSTTLYARVAAAAGTPDAPLMSAYTTHVTGMSEAAPPPPPPPAPDPVEVTFSLSEDAKKKHFLIADDDDDEATAMATVNTEISVESNTSAVIMPMFVENANGVSVDEGDNMPFSYVDWGLLQSGVLAGEATFMIQRTTMGANQEMEPSGDVAYVTCGPFKCSESSMEIPEAPELSIADSGVCNDWEADIQLQVGFVDNTATNLDSNGSTDGDPDGNATLDDGIDVGWVYTSNADLEVMHHFGGTLVLEAKAGKASRMTALSVSGGSPALVHPVADTDSAPDANKDDTLADLFGADSTAMASERWACNSTGELSAPGDAVPDSDYNPANLSVTLPDECFRISANGVNYLADYSVELAAVGSAVSWGSVDWGEGEDNPFDGLSCETMTVAAADEVDVCALFEDEVDRALEAGWGGGEAYLDMNSPVAFIITALDVPTDRTTIPTDATALAARAAANVPSTAELNWETESESGSRQFGTIWYDIDGDGEAGDNLYKDTEDTGTGSARADAGRDGLVVKLLDSDGDPMYGDIGKIDVWKKGTGATATRNQTLGSDGMADNYSDGNAKCSDDDGGKGCDAKVVIEKDFTFTSGTAFECEVDRTLEIECTWDAQGQMALAAAGNITDTTEKNFLACKVLDP